MTMKHYIVISNISKRFFLFYLLAGGHAQFSTIFTPSKQAGSTVGEEFCGDGAVYGSKAKAPASNNI